MTIVILTRNVSPHGLLNEVYVNYSAYHIRSFGRAVVERNNVR